VNSARIGVLVLAIIAAGLAAFLVRGLVSSKNDQPQVATEAPASEVLVAAGPLEVGRKIISTDLRWQEWPASAVNPAFVTRQLAPNAMEQYVNTIARSPMGAGEPVTAEKLIDPNNAGFMSAMIQPGMRAVAMNIAPETSAGGFILPNDRVDIISTMKGANDRRDGSSTMRSMTLMRNIRVLAIDQTFKDPGSQVAMGKTATLEVTPGQAETLMLAGVDGALSLSLRSLAEGEVVEENANSEGSTVKVVRFGVENFVRVK